MAFKFVLLVLPALTLADIVVKLSGTFDGDASQLYSNYSGEEVDVITNTERASFGLNDYALKNAVRLKYGQLPDYVFLSSPTPWGDLYKSYSWTEVTRTLKPQKTRISAISSWPVIVDQKVFENNSTEPAPFDVAISKKVFNTYTLTWWTNSVLSIKHDINYDIRIASKHGHMTYFNYSSVWDQNTGWTLPVIIGTTLSVRIILQPGQAIISQLQTTRGNIQMVVEYAASLDGTTAVNYADKYKGYNFYGLNITECMDGAGISNQLISQEFIDIGFFSDSKILVSDRDSGANLMKVPC